MGGSTYSSDNCWIKMQGRLGWVLIAICVLGLVVWIKLGFPVITLDLSKEAYENLPAGDFGKSLVDLRVDETKQLFNLGLLVIGGLWGAVVINERFSMDIKKRFPELFLFCVANALLISAQFSHVWYLGYIHEAVLVGAMTPAAEPGMPNVFANDSIEASYRAQRWFLSLGILYSALTLISCKFRK